MSSADNQQRILGYFIEEAREHLETLEKGLLNLSTVVSDREEIDDLFRAAHSIKGGGAMLGFSSIQKAAHRLEDAFKILQEQPVRVDQTLESLFLSGYDVLKNLIEKLESGGLPEEEAKAIVARAEPEFARLQSYLEQMASTKAPEPVAPPVAATEPASQPIEAVLREMLQLFKQEDTLDNRRQLQELVESLRSRAGYPSGWLALIEAVKGAIANPRHTYRTLAPVAIKELKQGSDYLKLGRGEEIAPSESLIDLANATVARVLVPVEPQGAASVLRQIFDSQQLSQIAQLLAEPL